MNNDNFLRGCIVRLMVYSALVFAISLVSIIWRAVVGRGVLLWVVCVAVISFLIALIILLHIVSVVATKKRRGE